MIGPEHYQEAERLLAVVEELKPRAARPNTKAPVPPAAGEVNP